jgi:uncharacterized protein
MPERLNVWRFTDGKRGHENQTQGLLDALRRLVPVEETTLAGVETKGQRLNALLKRFPEGNNLPRPDLLVGAGRQTHWPLFAAKRATGARSIVLMRPSPWLQRRFDLCLVPSHDEVQAPNIVPTQGALTAIQPGGEHSRGRGVILIGGPSTHHCWDSPAIVQSIHEIVRRTETSIHWKLTTSRRTPPETTAELQSLAVQNLQVWPVEKTNPDWVPGELAASAFAWVTEDSVSMVYEAVTSGATTGILPVPRRRADSRVIRGLDRLVERGYVSRFDPSAPSPKPSPNVDAHLDEASRCARIVLERFFPELLPA